MKLAGTALAALALAAPAAAQVGGSALEELRTEGVYVADDAEMQLTAAEERDLEDRMRLADRRIFVAVLPASSGSPGDVLRGLQRELDLPGTYAVVVRRSFRAGSTYFEPGVVPELATDAFARRRDEGLAAVLREFVSLVVRQEERSAGRGLPGGREPEPVRAAEDDGTPWLTYVLLGAGAGGAGLYFLRRRRRRAAELDASRELTEEDLVALAEDVQALELEVAGNDAAESRYRRALDLYGQASERFDRADEPHELAEVTSLVDQGRFEMACARAVLEARELPERRPPCFFDPRHGPSTRDVVWSPPYGEERPVPACEACAVRVDEGGEPDAREVAYDGRRVPYWESRAAGPWAMGYFGGGLLPSFLMGSLLGSLMFPPSGYAGGYDQPGTSDDAGDFGGDDFGGGDFDGGGDFGGGDLGGGDF